MGQASENSERKRIAPSKATVWRVSIRDRSLLFDPSMTAMAMAPVRQAQALAALPSLGAGLCSRGWQGDGFRGESVRAPTRPAVATEPTHCRLEVIWLIWLTFDSAAAGWTVG